MTKEERLLELKEQENLYKVLDKYFDADWRSFVKDIRRQNDISNIRMFKILAKVKGADFVTDLIKFMGEKNRSAILKLTRKPKGILIKDSRFKTIPELMIVKFPSGSYRDGQVFIQIRPDRWVFFTF